jgi:uncharacterized protein
VASPSSRAAGRTALARVFLLFLIVQSAFGLDPRRLTAQGYVSDFANVVDAHSRSQLERYCAALEKATGVQVAIVTVTTLGERPIEDFAVELFEHWGIGHKQNDEGLLLLLAIRDRKNRIEVGYGLEPILPDGFVGSVLREMRPSLREQNYGPALLAGASVMGERVANAKGVALDRTLPRRAPPRETDGGFPLSVLFLLLLFLLFAGRRGGGGGLLAGMVLGQMLGGRSRYHRGGWGGGGFGGYGGRGGGFGGFGGFGGGRSGGGGASGSW